MSRAAALVLLAILIVVALRRREPDRAVMRPTARLTLEPTSSNPARIDFVGYADLQPSDPYPASLLP